MAELGLEPEVVGWEARMLPLCYAAPKSSIGNVCGKKSSASVSYVKNYHHVSFDLFPGLFSKTTRVHVFQNVRDRAEAHAEFNAFSRKHDCALVISGDSLKVSGALNVSALNKLIDIKVLNFF